MSVTLKIDVQKGDLAGIAADVGIAYVFRDDSAITGPIGSSLAGRLGGIAKADRFDGSPGQTHLWHTHEKDGLRCPRYLLLGLGKKDELTLDRYRHYLGDALIQADRMGAVSLAIPLLETGSVPFGASEAGVALAEGALLGTYRFDRYRSEARPGRRHLRSLSVAAGSAAVREVESGIALGEVCASATNFARDLVNEPAGEMTPIRMVGIAQEVASESKIGIRIIEPDEMRSMGMGGFLGVAQGSHNPPRLIQLQYSSDEGAKRRVAFLGKGVTFDSGGLSLKSSEGMETMKCDMAGSAAVLAAVRALSVLNPNIEVIGLMGMVENMPGGGAIRPGDVLRMMNGKSVEVRNTDAEGRLVLADLLSYASTMDGIEGMIDLATLTGACMVALGPLASGVMGNDQAMVDDILRAANRGGERMWPLPLYREYREHLKSDIADLKNTAIRWGGALTAGLFLQEFVKLGIPWVHIDIAGPAFGDKNYSYIRRGASGAGV
ncbi:MAG: leucyl aminopeptidase, partial [Acidobacteria bacterium]|nr:leucyl aminopeptidase [Acidobacteriota bacterium]